MCGIVAMYSAREPVRAEALERAFEELPDLAERHREPLAPLPAAGRCVRPAQLQPGAQ